MARGLHVLVFGWLFRQTTNKKLVVIALKQNKHLAFLSERFEAEQLVPVIDGPYRLTDAREAFRHFGAANHKGKVIIRLRTASPADRPSFGARPELDRPGVTPVQRSSGTSPRVGRRALPSG